MTAQAFVISPGHIPKPVFAPKQAGETLSTYFHPPFFADLACRHGLAGSGSKEIRK